MFRAIAIVLIAVFVIGGATASISLAIDSWIEDSPTSTPSTTAGQIVAAMQAADAKIDSLQFEARMDVMSGTMTYDMNASVDLSSRRMYMRAKTTQLLPERMEADVEMYVIGDWVYTKQEQPGMPPEMSEWVKFWSPGYLEEQDIASQQVDLLTDFVDLKVLGTEVVSGIECYKLKATIDMGEIWTLAESQLGMEELYTDLEDVIEDVEDMITDFYVLEWIAKDTYFPVKFLMGMTMTLEGESFDVTMTGLIHHINEPVSIELPPEAADAVEVPVA